MSIEAMNMALEFVSWFASDDHSVRPKHKAPEIAQALRQAIEHEEKQDYLTIAYMSGAYDGKKAKREWVGLTEEEMTSLRQKSVMDGMTRIVSDFEYIRAIEAKLKEKNSV